jgi:glyoxylase-like metal-dependent hydrolase (beta-lactamase superfamily II)
MQQIDIGAARLNVLNLGDLQFALRDVISVPEGTWRPRYGDLFDRKLGFPSQSVLVSIGKAAILVDVGDYWKFAAEGSEYVEKGYRPPAGLLEQLSALKVGPESVRHVVITHAHYDHFAGVTIPKGKDQVLTFPNAVHYLGKADWEWAELAKAVADPSSNEARTLGRLNQVGALRLVPAEMEIVPGVSVVPTPGESPGHQILRVRSEGQTAYCVGDLFHSAVEIENPSWMPSWCDPESNLRSRELLIDWALREEAVVIPAHMPPGHVVQAGSGAKYEELTNQA